MAKAPFVQEVGSSWPAVGEFRCPAPARGQICVFAQPIWGSEGALLSPMKGSLCWGHRPPHSGCPPPGQWVGMRPAGSPSSQACQVPSPAEKPRHWASSVQSLSLLTSLSTKGREAHFLLHRFQSKGAQETEGPEKNYNRSKRQRECRWQRSLLCGLSPSPGTLVCSSVNGANFSCFHVHWR